MRLREEPVPLNYNRISIPSDAIELVDDLSRAPRVVQNKPLGSEATPYCSDFESTLLDLAWFVPLLLPSDCIQPHNTVQDQLRT